MHLRHSNYFSDKIRYSSAVKTALSVLWLHRETEIQSKSSFSKHTDLVFHATRPPSIFLGLYYNRAFKK